MQREGCIAWNEAGRTRKVQRLVRQAQRAALVHAPEQATGDKHQGEQHASQRREEGAGLHGPAKSDGLIFIHHRRMAP